MSQGEEPVPLRYIAAALIVLLVLAGGIFLLSLPGPVSEVNPVPVPTPVVLPTDLPVLPVTTTPPLIPTSEVTRKEAALPQDQGNDVVEGFSFTVRPVKTSAPAGGTVVYHTRIESEGRFSGPVTLSIRVTAPFYDTTFDLGQVEGPYPRELEYPFTVPGYVPAGVTIKGDLMAVGGGRTVQKTVSLVVT